jgi:tetratricopeptide (TPR) repeat protein
MSTALRAFTLLAAILLAASFAAPPSALAMPNDTPSSPPPKDAKPKQTDSKKRKPAPKKQDKKSEQQFIDGYKAAYAMIYTGGDYTGGIAKLRTLSRDDHPDVANLIGFSSRKLGRYDDAKLWYEKALKANPNHTLTWSYYGMWHAEQGNMLKARDHLVRIASICGNTQCREYVMLKEVIEGTRAY